MILLVNNFHFMALLPDSRHSCDSWFPLLDCRGDCRGVVCWTKGRGAVKTRPMNEPPREKNAAELTKARLLVLAAAVLWSTSGVFVKAPHLKGWSGPALAFWRAAFACVVLWPLVRRPQWSWKLIPATATFAVMNYTYLTAMAKGTAANAIWLQSTAPVWVLLAGVLVFAKKRSGATGCSSHSPRRAWDYIAL